MTHVRIIPELDSSRAGAQAARLVGRLVAAGVDLSLEGGDIVFNGSPHSLGQEAIAALRENKSAVVSLFERNRARGISKLGPTSWEQRRMEWRCRIDRNPATYNVCMRMDLLGAVDAHRIARIAAALVERHEILRTRFAWYGEHLLQEVMAPPRSVLQVLEPAVLHNASDQEISDWCARRGAAAFDLAAEAPVRLCYAQVGPQQAVLLITFHHIACDGWSIERLLEEVETLGGAERLSSRPDPVMITPCEFARWELTWLSDPRTESARAFWTEELRGAMLAPKLARWNNEAAPGGDAGCVRRKFTVASTTAVTAAAQALAMSEFSLYFAAFAMLLHQETDGRDCVAVIAVANRTIAQHDELMGLTRNAQPIRCSAHKGDTIDVVARRISERVEGAIAYQWYPLSLIVPPGDEPVDIRRLPITFGFAGLSKSALQFDDFSATLHDVYLGAARAEFSLLVRHQGDTAEAFFEYAKARLSPEDAGLMADRYVEIVAAEVGRWACSPLEQFVAEPNSFAGKAHCDS